MKLYNSNYGPISDTLLPQFEIRGKEIYATNDHPNKSSKILPWYEIRDKKIYTTIHNPEGHTAMPMYEIRGNNIHTTLHNPQHMSMPKFHIR